MGTADDSVGYLFSDSDTINYTSLYDAIRANNEHVITELVASINDAKCLPILSETYQDIKLKNIPLTQKTQFLVESKIIDLQFISEDVNEQKDDFKTSLNDVKNHLTFVYELIDSFLQKYYGTEFEIDMEFIFHARYIAQQISVLKRRVDYTYDILPWEEMQFYLVIYLHTLINPEMCDFIYKLIVSQKRILHYLLHFNKELVEIKLYITEEDLKRKKGTRRNVMKENILKRFPIFEDLYNDCSLLRDIYSLERIKLYMSEALSVDFNEKNILTHFVIERTLQVMGEYMKNSPDAPNLSDDLYKSLLKSAPRNIKRILINLRNMLSHAFSLNRKLELEAMKEPDFFTKIQKDLQKIHVDIVYVLYKQKIEALKEFLNRISDLSDLEHLRSIISQYDISCIQEASDYAINLDEFLKVKELISRFCQMILEEYSDESEAIADVLTSLTVYETKIKNVSITYVEAINKIFNLIDTHNDMNVVKGMVRTYLNMLSVLEPQSLYGNVFKKLRHIHDTFKKRRNYDSENFLDPDEKVLRVGNIIIEIYSYLKWRMRRIHWIEEMEEKLTLSEQETEKEIRAQDVFQMVQDQLDDENDKLQVQYAVKKAQKCHSIKYELMECIDDDSEGFERKLKFLDLSAKRKKEILYCHEKRKRDKLLLMIKEIDDDYGTFLKKLGDIFPVSTFINPIKGFFRSLKLKKNLQTKIDKAIADAVNEEMKKCYRQRLRSLRICLNDNKVKREGKSWTIALEMLVLDVLEILENVGLLADNKMLIAEDSPLLTGKQLRNYLAHGDIMADLMPYDKFNAIYFHAKKLSEIDEDILIKKEIVLCSTKLKNHSFSFQSYFAKCLSILRNQINLFERARTCNVEEIQEMIEHGGDILGMNINGWSALNYAIDGSNQETLKHLLKLIGSLDETEVFKLAKFCIIKGSFEITKYLIEEMALNINYLFGNSGFLINIALEYDREDIAKLLMEKGAKLDILEANGRTTLHYASESGCLSMVETILNEHADIIDSVTNNNTTSLHLATKQGHTDIVRFLLDNKANVDIKNHQGLKAFHLAAKYGHTSVLKYFLSCSKTNIPYKDIIEMFNLSAQNGNLYMVQVLLDNTSNLGIKSEVERSILHLVSQYGHKTLVKWLLDNNVDIHSKDINGKTALHLASQFGHCDVVSLLIQHGIDLNIQDQDQRTAMHWASRNRHFNIVKQLLLCNSSVTVDNEGKTAFHIATENGDVSTLHLFLEYKIDMKTTTTRGQTALHLAAYNGCYDVGNILISMCCIDVNAKDDNNETALIIAADNGHTDFVELLLKHEADIHCKNKNNGYSALTTAGAQGHLDVVVILIKYKADIEIQDNDGWRPIHSVVQNGYSDILEILLRQGVNVNARFKHGGTALHTAIRSGHTDIVRKLVIYGADINALLMTILPLRVAAHFGHYDIVMILVNSGAEVDAYGTDKVTPLHAATWNGHINVVKLLIKHGADVNLKSEEGWTALHFAVKFGFINIVQFLIENSADIFARNNFGGNAFHSACEMGHNEIVCMLLHCYKIEVDIKSSNGATGLHWASANGRVNVVETLVNNGADVNSETIDGSTPLHLTAQLSGSIEVLEILIRNGAKVNIKDLKGATPLHLACINGNEYVVGVLLSNDADINAESHNISPLHLAVSLGHKGIARKLLNKGALVNNSTIRKKTCLHVAVDKGYNDIVQMLLENGAEVNPKDENNMTPLHFAVLNGYGHIVTLLLERGAALNSIDRKNRTPLQIAFEGKHEYIVKILIENSVDVRSKTIDDFTYLHLACSEGMQEAVSAILEQGVDINDNSNCSKIAPLHLCLFNSHESIAQFLIERKADVNAATAAGCTPLHIAAGKGLRNIVSLLISHGAKIDALTRDAETPLYFASLQGHLDIVEDILKNGASANVKTLSKGLTPLSVAVQEGHLEILNTLIRYNADVNSRTCQGINPLHISSLFGHKACIEILLDSGADIKAVTNTGWNVLHIAASEGHEDIIRFLISKDTGNISTENNEGDKAIDIARKQGHSKVVDLLSEYS